MSRAMSYTLVGTTVTALLFAGLTAAPASAETSCTVNGGYLRINQSHGPFVTTTTVNASGASLGPGVVTVPSNGQNGKYGSASGSINGRTIDARVIWNDGKGTAHFTGTVGDDGIARGNSTGSRTDDNPWRPGPWVSSEPLNCAPGQGAAGLSARIVNDVDVYNIPDGPGKEMIGTLRAPGVVPLLAPCSFDGFCQVSVPNMRGGKGFAWAPGLLAPA